MQLKFLGAASTVTGSKYLIEDDQKNFLVDCGLFQGLKEWRLKNWLPLPLDPKTIDAVILTHAHLDHTGYLPILVRDGFRGPIYASKATRDLTEILLLDAGRIQEEDTKRANRYGYSKHHPALPLYTEIEARAAIKQIQAVNFDKTYPLSKKLTFTLAHSGHILGSSFATLNTPEISLFFSGDLGRPNDPVMIHPVQFSGADYLVLESTYGDRLHPTTSVLEQMSEILNSTFAKGGTVIIPSFAVGRAQSILYYIYKLKEGNLIPNDIPVYLDSPMAINATSLLEKYSTEHQLTSEEWEKVCSVAQYVQSKEDSKRLNNLNTPAIIITSSGMAEGGRVLHHLIHFGQDPQNTILFTGFQAEGTRGDRMLKGEKEIKIFGNMIPIRARVENIETLSSHADYQEILDWLKGFKKAPKQVFLTHGESNSAQFLKVKIEETFGWNVSVPNYLDSFNLIS